MEGRADELEKQLTRSFSINNGSGNLMNTHWQDIKKRLKEGEAAIEFSHFPFFDGRNWTDSTIYAAIILRYDAFYPVIIKLFEARQLESILHRDSYSDFYYIKDLYNGSDANVNMGSGKGRMLFDIIWKPMEKYLDGIRTIYYSPSGRLHQLSFAAIPCGERELLSDKYSLHQLISTAQVATGNKEKHVREVVLYGGVNYDASIMELRFPSGKNDHTALSGFPDQNYSPEKVYEKSRPWMYLEGTLREVDSIKRIAGDKGIKVKILSDKEATEESLKNITSDSCPDVIHFSTHGFFFADPERNYEKSGFFPSGERTDLFMEHSDNPLMRAGLVLAGANYAWAGGAVPSDIDDGILTAYEVSNLYLPNTELVVLSACETGLGEVKGSEGVYGLQRSFKIAGADYILMTLWQIPDSQTVELMSRFYTEWFSGRSVPEALIAAQRYMKHNYPLQPYMWAAFVLIR